jgi:hypothetical protein
VASNSITRAEATSALLNSGYLLESRVEKVLVARGYYVDANDAYPDPATAKSRELDLAAITARRLSRDYDFVFNMLLVECVNNPQPLVLLTKTPQVGFLFHEDLRLAGLPAKLFDERTGRWTTLQEALHLEKFHHYCTPRVATEFCSFAKKGGATGWRCTRAPISIRFRNTAMRSTTFSISTSRRGASRTKNPST